MLTSKDSVRFLNSVIYRQIKQQRKKLKPDLPSCCMTECKQLVEKKIMHVQRMLRDRSSPMRIVDQQLLLPQLPKRSLDLMPFPEIESGSLAWKARMITTTLKWRYTILATFFFTRL